MYGKTPEYRVEQTLGPDHARTFQVAVLLSGKTVGSGSGRSKKEAEQAAAREGLAALQGGSRG